MAKKRSELQMKKEGFFYVPQWPTVRYPGEKAKKSPVSKRSKKA